MNQWLTIEFSLINIWNFLFIFLKICMCWLWLFPWKYYISFLIQLKLSYCSCFYFYICFQGIPEFDNIQNLVDVLTNFIYICSVEHSATNYPQYDQYAFPPNMAATLHSKPDKSAVVIMNIELLSLSLFHIYIHTYIYIYILALYPRLW